MATEPAGVVHVIHLGVSGHPPGSGCAVTVSCRCGWVGPLVADRTAGRAAYGRHLAPEFVPSPAEPAAGLCRHSGDDMAPRRDELPAGSYPAEPAGPRDYCAHTEPACDECRNPVETTPADVCLDAARRYYNAMDMSPGQHAPMSTDEMIEWLANGEPDVGEAERDPIWFRAAVDAARAPLLAENADLRRRLATVENDAAQWLRIATEARAEVEQFRARLAGDGFVAVTRQQWQEARAAALPEGVELITEYVVVKAGEVVMLVGAYDSIEEATADLHLYPGERVTTRKVWYGAPVPVDGTEATGG